MTSGPAPTGALPPEPQPDPPTTDDALDVGPLFDTPQITTDTAGRHWRQGREYVAVDVDGELDYRPKEDVTETTTQPPPQVVAWMRGYLREHPDARRGDAVHAYRRTHGVYQPPAWDALYAAEDAARRPLTVADIPAGQGVASLFIALDADGKPSLWRQRTAGAPEAVYRPPSHGSKGEALLWALIESHVPTIDTTEEST